MKELLYENPVWPGAFADPYVLRVGDTYYAYGTSPADESGKEFAILVSPNLVHWQSAGGALEPLTNPSGNNYWAPAVIAHRNEFLLFYSASTSGSDADQRLRVARSGSPLGPFRDTGKLLAPELGFTIDADPFIDPRDGKAYLYFCADYVSDEPTGTAICVIPLAEDLLNTAGEPRLVVRASAAWQIYERNRNYKGKTWPAWVCVEGPCVVYHEGKYYCFYSGGAWHGSEYGVEVAVADYPLGPWHDDRAKTGPSVLKAVANKVIGPGHNSVVPGPDGRLFMVYHAWDPAHTHRRMCIDPIVWPPDGPRVDGPSTEARPLAK